MTVIIDKLKRNIRKELFVDDAAYQEFINCLDTISNGEKPEDTFFVKLAESLRELWPPGSKIVIDKKGNMQEYPWRDSVGNLASRLEHMWMLRKLPVIPIETCVSVAERYLSKFENDTKYMKTLKYFILRQDKLQSYSGPGKRINESPFADMLEGKTDEDAVQNEWENILNGVATEEVMII